MTSFFTPDQIPKTVTTNHSHPNAEEMVMGFLCGLQSDPLWPGRPVSAGKAGVDQAQCI